MKSTNESKEAEREKLGKKLTNSSARSPGTRKRTIGNLVNYVIFKREFINNKLPIRVVFVRSQYTNQQKPGGKTWGKNLLGRVPGHRAVGIGFVFIFIPPSIVLARALRIIHRVPPHRRLAISRLRVPNLDGFVSATAGNLLSIGAPHHRPDPEITRSHHTNQQAEREILGKKLTPPSARSPSTRKRTFGNLLHLCHFQACIYQQQVTNSRGLSYRHSKKEHVFFVIVLAYS